MKTSTMKTIDPADFYHKHKISPPSELFDELSDTYYFAKNIHGQFVFTNKLLNTQFDIANPKDVIGKTDYDFFRKDIADKIRQDDMDVMYSAGQIKDKLEVLISEEGLTTWLMTTKRALKNPQGEVIGIEGISVDAYRSQVRLEPYHLFKASLDYIHQHYRHSISIAQLAELSNMSISAFERNFKKHLGATPKHYIRQYRIQEACHLLNSGMTIQAVADATGFCDQSYFTKEFRLIMGMTPKNYRDQ